MGLVWLVYTSPDSFPWDWEGFSSLRDMVSKSWDPVKKKWGTEFPCGVVNHNVFQKKNIYFMIEEIEAHSF